MKRALKEASKSDHANHKHATLLFKGGSLMAAGYNLDRKHAEIMALNKVKHKGGAKNMIAVNVRMTKSGIIGIAKPCIDCHNALKAAGVASVVYTNKDGIFETEVL